MSYLVKSGKDVVGKLYLRNGCGTGNSYTDAKSHNALLTKRSVEDSVLTWGEDDVLRFQDCWIADGFQLFFGGKSEF